MSTVDISAQVCNGILGDMVSKDLEFVVVTVTLLFLYRVAILALCMLWITYPSLKKRCQKSWSGSNKVSFWICWYQIVCHPHLILFHISGCQWLYWVFQQLFQSPALPEHAGPQYCWVLLRWWSFLWSKRSNLSSCIHLCL